MQNKNNKSGKVLCKSGTNSYKVKVSTLERHPVYKKVMKKSKNYIVHWVGDESIVGQQVWITPCRPLSKTKSWKIHSIIEG